MPLNAQKIAHVKATVQKTFTGRGQQVTLTMRTAGGGTTTLTVSAVWRTNVDADPTIEGPNNKRYHLGADPDAYCMFDAATITYAQLRSVIYLTLTTPQGPQFVTKYTLLDIEPIGMIADTTRYFTKWMRQH